MMMVGGRKPSPARIFSSMVRAMSTPFMPGIFQSSSRRSKASPRAWASSNRRSPSTPEGAVATWKCQRSSRSRRMASEVGWSSMTSARWIFRCCSRGAERGSAAGSPLTPSWTVKAKVLPRFGSLATVMRPPISSTSWRLMVSPSPVPPKRRVTLASTWANGWNRRALCSGDRPMPVSRTLTRKVTVSGAGSIAGRRTSRRTWISPRSVNLMALPTRLLMTWPKRSGSPRSRSGTSGAMSMNSSSPFSPALMAKRSLMLRSTSSSENSTCSMSMQPASTFE